MRLRCFLLHYHLSMASDKVSQWLNELVIHNPTECIICQESYTSESSVVKLPNCSHQFHRECLKDWITTKMTDEEGAMCPVCKTAIEMVDKKDHPRTSVVIESPSEPRTMSCSTVLNKTKSIVKRSYSPTATKEKSKYPFKHADFRDACTCQSSQTTGTRPERRKLVRRSSISERDEKRRRDQQLAQDKGKREKNRSGRKLVRRSSISLHDEERHSRRYAS